jgi:hypothetical protein
MKEYLLNIGEQMSTRITEDIGKFIATLKEPVDPVLLQKATEQTLAVHKGFAVKREVRDGLCYWVENPLKPVVRQWPDCKNCVYGDADTNEFPWEVLYAGKDIIFAGTHAMTDGGGIIRFMGTLLCKYFVLAGVKIADYKEILMDESSELSLEDGFEVNFMKNSEDAVGVPTEKAPSFISEDFFDIENKSVEYTITLSKKQISDIAHGGEVSTFAVIAYMLAKTMERFLEGNESNIQIQVPIDMRPYFGSRTDHNFSTVAHLNYDQKRMGKRSKEFILTVFRSHLDIITDKGNLQKNIDQIRGGTMMVTQSPEALNKLVDQYKVLLTQPIACWFYTHMTQLGYPDEVMEKLEDFRVEDNEYFNTRMVALGITFGDKINLIINQHTKNNGIIQKLKEVLDENSIEYTISNQRKYLNAYYAIGKYDE